MIFISVKLFILCNKLTALLTTEFFSGNFNFPPIVYALAPNPLLFIDIYTSMNINTEYIVGYNSFFMVPLKTCAHVGLFEGL